MVHTLERREKKKKKTGMAGMVRSIIISRVAKGLPIIHMYRVVDIAGGTKTAIQTHGGKTLQSQFEEHGTRDRFPTSLNLAF